MAERILITGGAGFIGSHTADRLVEKGYNVRLLDILAPGTHPHGRPDYLHPDAELQVGDVSDRNDLSTALAGVDRILHLAAFQDYLPQLSRYFATNTVSTALLYELITEMQLDVAKVVIASSQVVQGEGLYETIDGEIVGPHFRSLSMLEQGIWDHVDSSGRPMRPIETPASWRSPHQASPYALSKESQELQGRLFGERYQIPTTSLRYGIVQGGRQSIYSPYSGACRIFSLSYMFGRPPVLYEDGFQIRDFVNVHDVVEANLIALFDERTDYGVYNVSAEKGCTLREFDRVVAEEFNRGDIEPLIPGSFRLGDMRHALSDCTPLHELGWQQSRTIEDSVREYADYLRQQRTLPDRLEIASQTLRNARVVRTVTR